MIHLWVSLELISMSPSVEIINLVVDLDHLLNELAECVWCIHPNKFLLDFWLQAVFE